MIMTNQITLHKSEDGKPEADSRDIAADFGKRHGHVIDAIRNILAIDPEAEPDFRLFKIKDLSKASGESTSHYLMNRDGFIILAMGFTGEAAMKWKRSYIKAFNAMEAALTTQPLTRAQLARNWADAEERAEAETKRADHNKAVAIAKTAQLAQTESAISLITSSEKSITMTEAAKPLGMKPHAFVAWMIVNKWIYQSSGGYVANQIRINDGCLEQKFFDRNVNDYIDEYHPARRPQVMVKVKGMAKLAKIFATIEDKAE
jgi:anti-repressor protein